MDKVHKSSNPNCKRFLLLYIKGDYWFLGCDDVWSSRYLAVFQVNVQPPWSAVAVEVAGSPEVSVCISHTAWCHILEDSSLHSHCCENLLCDSVKDSRSALLTEWAVLNYMHKILSTNAEIITILWIVIDKFQKQISTINFISIPLLE